MSEENEQPSPPPVEAIAEIKSAQPPQKKQRRARAKRARANRAAIPQSFAQGLRDIAEGRVVDLDVALTQPFPQGDKPWIPSPVAVAGTLTLEQIIHAKAIIAQAEAALGVVKPKAKEAPQPLHPQSLEDPAQGDKTPAVVEWYQKHAPEEYQRRYAGRKTHLADRTRERRFEPLPLGVSPAPFPADPDGFTLSPRDDSGRSPRNTADL